MNSTYNCIECGIECKSGRSKVNKYCNNVCKGVYEYKHVHMPLILEGKKNYYSGPLRKYIFERDENTCQKCGLGDTWDSDPLSLQLDHIDGDCNNNFPNNLRLLCPNCHTQTTTWGSKERGSGVKQDSRNTKRREKYKQCAGNSVG